MWWAGREGSEEETYQLDLLVFSVSDYWCPLPGAGVTCPVWPLKAASLLSPWCLWAHSVKVHIIQEAAIPFRLCSFKIVSTKYDLSCPFGPQKMTYIFAYPLSSNLVRLTHFSSKGYLNSRGHMSFFGTLLQPLGSSWPFPSAVLQTFSWSECSFLAAASPTSLTVFFLLPAFVHRKGNTAKRFFSI